MLPKLECGKLSYAEYVQCSSSNPDVTAAILSLAGDLVKSEVRIRTAGKPSDKTHHLHSDTKEKKRRGGG